MLLVTAPVHSNPLVGTDLSRVGRDNPYVVHAGNSPFERALGTARRISADFMDVRWQDPSDATRRADISEAFRFAGAQAQLGQDLLRAQLPPVDRPSPISDDLWRAVQLLDNAIHYLGVGNVEGIQRMSDPAYNARNYGSTPMPDPSAVKATMDSLQIAALERGQSMLERLGLASARA